MMGKPRLLIVTSECPVPAHNGVRAKVAMLLEGLRGLADVDLVVYSESAADRRELRLRWPWVQSVYWVATGPKSRSLDPLRRYESRFPASIFNDLSLRTYDGVHLDTMALGHLAAICEGRPTIWSINDSYSRSLRLAPGPGVLGSLRSRISVPVLARYERRTSASVLHVDVVSRLEQEYLAKIGVTNVRVLPLPRDRRGMSGVRQVGKAPVICMLGSFTGRMGRDSLDFLGEGWPLIRAAHPQCRVRVVGRVGDDYRSALEELQAVDDRVQVWGYVEDLDAAFTDVALTVAPFGASLGMSTRALDSLQNGLPVVGGETLSSLPSEWSERAYYLRPGGGRSQAECVTRLLDDPLLYSAASASAIQMMEEWPTPRDIAARYLESLWHAG